MPIREDLGRKHRGRLRGKALLGILALGLAFPAGAQESPDTARFVGCYTLEEGSWEPPFEQLRDHLPDTLRLLGEKGTEFPEAGRLLVRPQMPWGAHRIAAWRPTAADSVQIHWSDGFVGYQLNVGFSGRRATGWARTLNDEEPSLTRYSLVVLAAVDCGDSGQERDDEPAVLGG